MRPEREREADPGRASWSRQALNGPGLERATQVLALLDLKPFVIANGLTVAPRVEVRRGGRQATRSPSDGEFDFEKIHSSLVGVIARQ